MAINFYTLNFKMLVYLGNPIKARLVQNIITFNSIKAVKCFPIPCNTYNYSTQILSKFYKYLPTLHSTQRQLLCPHNPTQGTWLGCGLREWEVKTCFREGVFMRRRP